MNEVLDFLKYKDSFYKIYFKVLIYNGKLFIRVQDPKYAKKIARNQMFSEAKLLSFRIDTVCYDQLFELAYWSQHFFLKHDVNKQDDEAALHTFHSNNLMQILVNNTLIDETIGLFVYLFILDNYLYNFLL